MFVDLSRRLMSNNAASNRGRSSRTLRLELKRPAASPLLEAVVLLINLLLEQKNIICYTHSYRLRLKLTSDCKRECPCCGTRNWGHIRTHGSTSVLPCIR